MSQPLQDQVKQGLLLEEKIMVTIKEEVKYLERNLCIVTTHQAQIEDKDQIKKDSRKLPQLWLSQEEKKSFKELKDQ